MNRETVEVFHALMKKGWIDRQEDARIWSFYEQSDVRDELEAFKDVMGIDLYRVTNRVYLVPTQENDLFLKNNVDYRKDIRADNSVRSRDLYLMNYLSIYLIYLFFKREGDNPLSRDSLSKQELIELFTEHCSSVTHAPQEGEETDYSENFIELANTWLSKIDGEPLSQKIDHRYGIINRLLLKYKADELFTCGEDQRIRPTQKMKDLMPYFLRKERIREIQNWIREEQEDAENQ